MHGRSIARWTLLLLILALGLAERDAHACINATMNETDAVKKLKEAEIALDQGDVLTTRELANEVRESHIYASDANDDLLRDRASRLSALSKIRDPGATTEDIEGATEELRHYAKPDEESQTRAGLHRAVTPALLADFGEALEREGSDDEALAVLEPLANKDLIGSAYANAALSRLAKKKGDAALSSLAMQRCEATAPAPAACRGAYPRQPFVRGRAQDFAIIGGLFGALALLRLVRTRKTRLWSAFRAPIFAGVVALFGAGSFALVNLRTVWPSVVLWAVLFLLLLLQRGQWIEAVRRNRVPGFAIRIAEPDDAAPKTLWFLDGPRLPQVLEQTPPEGYREPARPPVLFRLEQNKVPVGAIVVLATLLLVAWGVLSLTMRAR